MALTGWHVEVATDSGFTRNRQVSGGGTFTVPVGSTVYARVAAKNIVTEAAGTVSVFSNTASVRLATVPAAMAYAPLTQQVGRTLKVEYTAPADGGAPILRYEVEASGTNDFTGAKTVTSTTLSAILSDLPVSLGDGMHVRVRAVNAVGAGGWSPTSARQLATEPGRPLNLKVTQLSPTEVRLNWDAPTSDGDSPITGHVVLVNNRDADWIGAQWIASGPERTFTLKNRQPGSAYYVRVAATNIVITESPDFLSTPVRVVMRENLDRGPWAGFTPETSGVVSLEPAGVRRGSLFTLDPAPVGLIRETQAASDTTETNVPAYGMGIRRTIDGLTVGRTYTLRATAVALSPALVDNYALGVEGIGFAPFGDLEQTGETTPLPEFEFEATAESHVILIAAESVSGRVNGFIENTGFHSLEITEDRSASPYRLQSTVYESTLANHFSLACQSVGAVWFVDSADRAQFRQFPKDAPVRALFSDTRAPGHLEFISAEQAWDTRNTITRLESSNRGVNPLDGNDQTRSSTFYLSEETELLGVRKATLETNISTPLRLANLVRFPTERVKHWAKLDGGASWSIRAGEDATILRAIDGGNTRIEVGHSIPEVTADAGRARVFTTRVTPGSSYFASVEVEGSNLIASGQIKVTWLNRNATQVSATVENSYSVSGTPQTYEVGPLVAPAGAAALMLSVAFGGPSVPAGAEVKVRKPLVVESDTAMPYVDGGTKSDRIESYSYLGDTGATIAENVELLWKRVAEVFEDHAHSAYRVSSIRWNAQENPDLAAQLEIQDRITILLNGTAVTDYRVVGIRHEADGTRWIVTLDVVPNQAA
ncbi:fibronectin type III domain-containing protein [Microbacterium sp. cf332]|uniref:fibronectin type III domain-containing protein n=1 Tax=Microbacterium sp. cf332 TaxID=1761804 RepID=UPI0015A3C79D|nr:fibronectin type III domain-containing protein [Microbacterium sp. cf332]